MQFLNLGKGNDTKAAAGMDLPGTVSLYLVELDTGVYYVKDDNAGIPICTSDWDKAKHFFVLTGLLEAKEIAQRHHGHVCIVNCSPVQRYMGD